MIQVIFDTDIVKWKKMEHIKEIMGVKEKPDIIDIIDKKAPVVWPR